MRVAVTGATGFLGSWVVRHALDAGHAVVALGRNRARGDRLEEMGATFFPVDLHDHTGLAAALAGVDAVIHSAALSSPWGTRAAFEQANLLGTRKVAQAALRAGVQRLVFVSSASVYASSQDRIGWKETDPLPLPINAYAASKQAAEADLAQHFPADRLVVLRPRAIFGLGDAALWPRLYRAADRNAGTLPLFRGGKHPMDLLYVEDAAAACLAALTGEPGTYNLTQGDPRPVKDVLETVFAHRGLPLRWKPVPLAPALWVARALERWHAWRRLPGEPLITAYGLCALAYGQTLDLRAARAGLGWTPRWNLDAALAHTFRAPSALLSQGLFA